MAEEQENTAPVDRGDNLPEPVKAAAPEPEVPEVVVEEPETEKAAVEEPKVDEDDTKGHMIPKTRFDQAVQKERGEKAELAQRLKQYQDRDRQQNEAQNFEESQLKVKEMLKQHSNLLADGDLDKASDVMEAVLQLRDDMQNARMERQANNARNGARIEVQYDSTVQRLEAEYPEINPDADDFDPIAVRRVQMMITGLMQNEGKNPAEALQEATDILLKPAKQAKGDTLRDAPSQEAVDSGLRRTQQQIDKNIQTAAKQPPSLDSVGKDHDKTGGALDADMLSSMSFDEFIKVPDSELAKMRGDFIQ